MAITFPLVFGVLTVAPQAAREAKAANRQQTSQGVVTAYDRSDHNQCSYTFSVLGRHYTGRRGADTTDVTVGDPVLVYYDSQDPSMNALEGFSTMSHRDRGFCSILLFVIGVFAAVVLSSKAVRSVNESQRHPQL
jgi:hypothetical protein